MLRKFFSIFKKKMTRRPALEETSDTQRMKEIFRELKDIKGKRERIEKYLKGIKQEKQDLRQYESLTKEDHEKVTQLLSQYKSIVEKRRLMEGRLIRNNPSLRIIQAYEKEIPELIQEIRQAETSQRYAQVDTMYLEDEKDYLYDYRESLISGYRALKFTTIGLVIILGITCIILFTLVQTLRQNIFTATSVIATVTLLLTLGILIFKRRIEYELEKNEVMQKKAMRLLNKVKVRYFHHTNYLSFQYDKLKIKNTDQLQAQYNRYLKNKNNETHYNQMNNQLAEIERRVFDILYGTGIERDVFKNMDRWIEVQNVEKLMENLNKEHKSTEQQLKGLVAYEQDLTKEAFIITETNPDLTSVVESLINPISN